MAYGIIAQIGAPTSDVIDFTGLSLSGYYDIRIKLEGVTPGSDGVGLLAQFRIGGSLITSGYRYLTNTLNPGGQNDEGSTSAASMSLTRNTTNGIGNAAGESFSGTYSLFNATEALHKVLRGHAAYTATSGTLRHVRSLGFLANTGTLDGIKFFLSSGTMTAGKATIFGVA